MSSKDECPPLLQAGLHKMSADELKAIVVDAFPLSKGRAELWENFLALVDQLRQAHLSGQIWVDGSFLTEKIEPRDVDFVFDVPIQEIENANPTQLALLEKLAKRGFRVPEKLHSFIMHTAPAAHTKFSESERLHTQWKKDFGLSYVKKEPKGIAVIEVQP
jgi:hypothetical protein